ncbi:hypothetical protein ACOMHN_039718 [Nucella lapillus]
MSSTDSNGNGGNRPDSQQGGSAGNPWAEDVLQQRLGELTLRYEVECEELLRRVAAAEKRPSTENGAGLKVEMTVPSQHRLKIFSGIAPSGGNEIDFEAWEEQAEGFLKGPDVKSKDNRLFASLKGIAAETVKDCQTNTEAVKTLRQIFGSLQDAEELLLTLSTQRIRRGETPAAFFSRLYTDLLNIHKLQPFTSPDMNQKLYRTFCSGIQHTHELLLLELRNRFGYPSRAHPSFVDLLHAVRQACDRDDAKRGHQQQHQVSTDAMSTEALVTKVVDTVMERLSLKMGPPSRSEGSVLPGHADGRHLRFTGHCFRCGLTGHYSRNCTNRPNPALVAEKEGRRKQHGGSHRGGLNGTGLLRKGAQD